MPEKPYTKREMDMFFKSMTEKNDAWSATIMTALEDIKQHELQPILKQTTLTNGRVSSLEKWRNWLTGAACISLLIAGYFLTDLRQDQQAAIDHAVDRAFAENLELNDE